MYIIMYKYSAFKINHKSFRSSTSNNFPIITGLTGELSRSAWEFVVSRRGITLFLP